MTNTDSNLIRNSRYDIYFKNKDKCHKENLYLKRIH